ncbi:p450 domain-containing protein [Cephalotus follicularis]|uniref:p450 domain-containing protein n=1 Tax=Cephalotus follicularis TaxID=3775 RepID=A0A1Q3CX71_CEPFO|nr:p450 domain-containing protein [Cephalotus follicularis]
MIYFYYFPFFFTFLFMVAKLMKETKAKNSTSKLPPGPRKLPVIGNIHQLIGSRPHCTLRDLAKKYGPLMHLQLGEVSTIVVSSPEMAKKIMKDHDIVFASRPSLLVVRIMAYNDSDILFAPYGNYWRQLRKILTMELLGVSRVKLFRSIREEEVSNLIKSISSYDELPINLSERIFSTNYGITSRAAFGKKCSVQDQEDFISVAKESGKLATGFRVADLYPSIKLLETIGGVRPKCEKHFRKMDRILQNIINEHRGRHGEAEEDIVDVLLKLQQQDNLQFPLTDENIKSVIADIFAAGSDTSSTVMEWAMSEMLKHPGIMKEAQNEVRNAFHGKGTVDEVGIEELKLLKAIIKETLRLHPPAPFLLPRECGENCEIEGYNIPVKSRVIVNAWAIGRDPTHWTEAETFRPERFFNSSIDYKGTYFQYIPFGAGRRICPGISFALPSIELQLAQLLYHFDWKLPNGMKPEDLDMSEDFAVTMKREKDLFLVPVAYHH